MRSTEALFERAILTEIRFTRAVRGWVLALLRVVALTGLIATLETPGHRAEAQTVAPPASPSGPAAGNAAAKLSSPDPETGSVVEGAYRNPYFGLSLPLPAGWSEDLAGPPPSPVASYVLEAIEGTKTDRATMLVVGQDLFFGAKPFANIAELAADLSDDFARDPIMTIDRKLAAITIAGHDFLRFDYHAGELYRVWLATELRCHVLSFNITGTDQARVERIARGLDAMSLPPNSGSQPVSADGEQPNPVCIKDYVTKQTVLRRIEPDPVEPRGVNLPVRFIIGVDGRIRHIHVINARPAQRRSIEQALTQWEFTPYLVAGHPTEVETGVLFNFKPTGQ